jgi:hypothetical protein
MSFYFWSHTSAATGVIDVLEGAKIKRVATIIILKISHVSLAIRDGKRILNRAIQAVR